MLSKESHQITWWNISLVFIQKVVTFNDQTWHSTHTWLLILIWWVRNAMIEEEVMFLYLMKYLINFSLYRDQNENLWWTVYSLYVSMCMKSVTFSLHSDSQSDWPSIPIKILMKLVSQCFLRFECLLALSKNHTCVHWMFSAYGYSHYYIGQEIRNIGCQPEFIENLMWLQPWDLLGTRWLFCKRAPLCYCLKPHS